ncbi:MAG TPA: hypothetical protein VMT53_22610, partial [Terriglobales bacterium]|nr:hypothetical protein [Terriglobales bacterium]
MSEYQASLLRQLEAMKRCFGPGAARQCERVLRKLSGVRYPGVQSLIAAHDNLLFLRAFPQSEMVARLADSLLSALEPQMERLASSEGNAAALDDESVSGMAGTTVANVLTYDLAKQLTARHGSALTANWNVDECYRQMGLTLPSALPLLEDDSYVEADTPYLKWIEAASSASTSELMWLLENLGKLEVSPVERAALYAGLQVEVEWKLRRSPASRTLARGKVSNLYCHEEPLLQRQQVSLDDEMAATPLPVQRLSRREAREVFNLVQDALTVRYRELQGTTYGDDKTVLKADPGRGLQLFLWGLQADWRLPLRAYYAGIALKNGVPINYFEAIGLFEWMEVGFNTFYAYREGET